MGGGLAKAFKERFPNMFKEYKDICDAKLLKPGIVTVHIEKGRTIVNFPTKDHWKNPSTYEYVHKGLNALADLIDRHQFKSVAIPALGCSLGGLDWKTVKLLISDFHEVHWKDDVLVEVYEPWSERA
jgi:O-acetyl-ADP-ribose deacetylase (regulator of RNase III)